MLAENGSQGPGPFFAVDIRQLLHPSINPTSFVWQGGGAFLLRAEFQEGLELLLIQGQFAFRLKSLWNLLEIVVRSQDALRKMDKTVSADYGG